MRTKRKRNKKNTKRTKKNKRVQHPYIRPGLDQLLHIHYQIFAMLAALIIAVMLALSEGWREAPRDEDERTDMGYSAAYEQFSPALAADHFNVSSNSDAKQRNTFFRHSRQNINTINNDASATYTAEYNKLSLLSDAEKQSYRGLNITRVIKANKLRRRKRSIQTEKRGVELNWYPDSVTAVKDQGSCGSCWAFAGVTVLESRAYINGGELQQYSEQEILDCNSDGDGCSGGWYSTVWEYVKSSGRIATTADYAYTNSQGSCSTGSIGNSLDMLISSYDDYGGWDESDLVSDLAGGPVAIAIEASDNWQAYGSGIFNECVDTNLNHGVVAVGYTDDYFYVRNSWGSDWGAGGYIKMGRDICTDYTYSYYSAHIESWTSAEEKMEAE